MRAAAQVYGDEAVHGLVRLMRGQNVKGKGRAEVLPQTQLAAMQELLNRGYGRPATAVTGEGGTGPATIALTIIDELHPGPSKDRLE